MCWIAWDKLTRGKREGGLGLRNLQDFNDALLSKLSWRILSNPDCLLARILKGKYFPNTTFLESKLGEGGSHGWKGIIIGRDLLKEKLGKIIGNGKKTSVWDDPWLSTKEPKRPMGPAPRQFKDFKVADLFIPNTRRWNEELINVLLPSCKEEILCIIPGSYEVEDRLAWLPQRNGEYTVKTGYYVARGRSLTDQQAAGTQDNFHWITDIWNGKFAPKLKLFLWKSVQGALPVGENLAMRGIMSQSRCTHCGEAETTLHLLFLCPFTQAVWDHAPFRNPVEEQSFTSVKEGISKLKTLTCLPPIGIDGGTLAPWILWSIWLSRNSKIFSNRRTSAKETLNLALIRAREWTSAQGEQRVSTQKAGSIRTMPPIGIQCHTDGAWNEERKAGGMGWTFHEDQKLIGQGSKAMEHIGSPIVAEGMAIRLALNQALDLGFTSLHVASDSAQVITAINSGDPLSEIYGILQDISYLSLLFRSVTFVSTPRKANILADASAKLSLCAFLAVGE
ncbi:unnamed protein product [Microthlaspi erraticum]|uniref:Uncharacterized protein n=1 Tax=Microthlaspi erraticum TaxID=1685480 RepID=A0A6D2I9V6_9BRAS|nr:unnamed protein product [Microthlaspi erraticum]